MKFLTPSFVTTVLGAVLAIGIGCADAWFQHKGVEANPVSVLLVGGGVGALLGSNPLQKPTMTP